MVRAWVAVVLFFVGLFVPFILAGIVSGKKSTKDRKALLKDFIDTHVLHDPSFEEYCELINLLRNNREDSKNV